MLGSQEHLIQCGKLYYCSHFHRNIWHFRGTQRNKWKPSRAATNFAKCYTRHGGWQGWGKKWPQLVVRWLSVISITFATKKGNGWFYHQLFPPLWQNQAPILCLIQKKHFQRGWRGFYVKYVLYSQFFPQVKKKHYFILKVYVHILGSSSILPKTKTKKNKCCCTLFV